jgi:uncharacterized membrane protein YebE (DUF533 family)
MRRRDAKEVPMSADRILSQLLGSGAAAGFAGGLAGGLASGLLTSKAGRKFGRKALEVGGIAAVGGIAYAAFSRYRASRERMQAVPPAGGSQTGTGEPGSFLAPPEGSREAEALGLTLVRAMAAAAQADGRLDPRERHKIHERVGSLDLSGAEKGELLAELGTPIDMGALVAAASTPEIATEIYTVSVLAIDVDTTAERAYLAMLAARLGLPETLVDAIHEEVGVSQSREVDAVSAWRAAS